MNANDLRVKSSVAASGWERRVVSRKCAQLNRWSDEESEDSDTIP